VTGLGILPAKVLVSHNLSNFQAADYGEMLLWLSENVVVLHSVEE
jgi:hypothetical protein